MSGLGGKELDFQKRDKCFSVFRFISICRQLGMAPIGREIPDRRSGVKAGDSTEMKKMAFSSAVV